MMNGYERGVLAQGRTLDRADIVVVGNGIAGLTAALEARRLAPDQRIVMITDQIHPTIYTPALKQFMVGKLAREQLLAHPAGTERAERIHVVTARVEEIHAESKYVTLTGGRGFGYGSLLLATGSAPVGLANNLPGRDFDGVLTLHRLQDYLDLRRRLSEVYEAVVIGSGAHAIETVMGLMHYGVHVHWMIRGETVLSRMLDQAASSMVLARMRRAGISIYTNTEVLGVVGRIGCVAGVITSTQQMIPCQLVIACTGTQAISTLAQRCTLPMAYGRGIQVDNQLRTSVPDVYAAGDVAALQDPITGHYETRALWYAAVTQGRAAAASILGTGEQHNFGVQWHATQLGDFSMLTIGNPLLTTDPTRQLTALTDSSNNGYRRITLLGDRLIGYLSLGQSQPDSLAIKRIIDEGHSVSSITKALLKGTFDARNHLSQQQSHAVRSLLTTGRLPALPTPTLSRPATGAMNRATTSITGPLLTMPSAENHARENGSDAHEGSRRQTDPLASISFNLHRTPEPSPQDKDSTNRRETGPLQAFEEEELTPFTGKLTAQSDVERVIDSTLVPVIPAPTHRTQTGNLWSYMPDSASMPHTRPQSRQEKREEMQRNAPYQRKSEKSSGLWAYSDYEDRERR